MAFVVNKEALTQAADDMKRLKERNTALKEKLENLFKDLTTALDTPAGHSIEWTGQDVLVKPLDDMAAVLEFVSSTLFMIIGRDENGNEAKNNSYYDKLFVEYDELDTTLKTKKTK